MPFVPIPSSIPEQLLLAHGGKFAAASMRGRLQERGLQMLEVSSPEDVGDSNPALVLLDADLVESTSYQLKPTRDLVREMVGHLSPAAAELDCEPYLQRVTQLADRPTWAQQQVDLLRETGDRAEVVRRMVAMSRLSGAVATM